MKICYLFRLELHRLLSGRMTKLAIFLSLLLPAAGYRLLPLLGWNTMAVTYLANPVSIGTLGSTLIFAVLALYELDRVRRNDMEILTNSIRSPLSLIPVRILCLACCVLLTATLEAVLYLPYTFFRMGTVFSLEDYLLCWFLLYLPGPVFGILIASACYFITTRTEVSFLCTAVFLFISRNGAQKKNAWWQWSLPAFTSMSDDFSNAAVFRVAAYCRLIWLCLLSGFLLLALLCVRRYKKGLFRSFLIGLRRPFAALTALCLMVSGGILWHVQPFFDHSPEEWISVLNAHPDHILDDVFLTGIELTTDVSPKGLGSLSGHVIYHMENTSGQPAELYLHINSGYMVTSAMLNGQPVEIIRDPSEVLARTDLICPLPAEKDITLEISYGGTLRIWNNDSGIFGSSLISRKYIDLPGFDLMPTPQIDVKSWRTPLHAKITIPDHLIPVTTGYATELLSDNGDGTRTWAASDDGATSLRLYAADYVKAELESGGLTFEFYYSKKHQKQLDDINAIPIIENAVAYCTEHYGPRSFAWRKPFKLLQGTEFLFGGFAASNISCISEESFTVTNLGDTDKGASGAEVLAHEIIHQWWGLGIMLMDLDEPYWTSEGITTYSTYRLMEDLYGEDYAKTYYLDKWEASVRNARDNFYIRYPEYLNRLPKAFATEILASINSVNLYDGMALYIKRAEELVGGQEQMDIILSKLYLEGGAEMPPYVTFDDFLNACGLTREEIGYE